MMGKTEISDANINGISIFFPKLVTLKLKNAVELAKLVSDYIC